MSSDQPQFDQFIPEKDEVLRESDQGKGGGAEEHTSKSTPSSFEVTCNIKCLEEVKIIPND